MSPSIEAESSSLIIESSSDNNNHLHYVSDLLSRSVEISKNLYTRTGLKNDFIEAKALRVNEVSSQFANILDTHIDATVSRVSTTTKKISKRTSETSLELLNLAKESNVIKTADSMANRLLTELESQVAGLTEFVQKRHQKQLQNVDVEESEQSSDKSPVQRVQKLVITLNEIGKLIAESYTEKARQTRVFQLASDASDQVVAYGRNASASAVSLVEVLYQTVLLESIVEPLFNSLQVNYTHAKETVTVTVNNIRKAEVEGLLVAAKNSYSSLQQASIAVLSKDQLSFVFTREFFTAKLNRIQNDIAQLLTDLTAKKTQLQNAVIALYAKSVEEFQRKKEERLNGKKAIVAASELEQAHSTEEGEDKDQQHEQSEEVSA